MFALNTGLGSFPPQASKMPKWSEPGYLENQVLSRWKWSATSLAMIQRSTELKAFVKSMLATAFALFSGLKTRSPCTTVSAPPCTPTPHWQGVKKSFRSGLMAVAMAAPITLQKMEPIAIGRMLLFFFFDAMRWAPKRKGRKSRGTASESFTMHLARVKNWSLAVELRCWIYSAHHPAASGARRGHSAEMALNIWFWTDILCVCTCLFVCLFKRHNSLNVSVFPSIHSINNSVLFGICLAWFDRRPLNMNTLVNHKDSK